MGRNVSHIGDRREHIVFWWGNQRERTHSEYLGLDGRLIGKYIFKNWDG